MQGYVIASYMVVMDSYTAGDNQLHDSTITPHLNFLELVENNQAYRPHFDANLYSPLLQ